MAEGNDFVRDSSLDLVLEYIVHDEESDLIGNWHQELFNHEGELREINLQEEQISENTERKAAENIQSRLLNIRSMCTDFGIRIIPFIQHLQHEMQEIEMENLTRFQLLHDILTYWQLLRDVLINILSEIEIL